MKTTAKDFAVFKAEFRRCQKRLGLTDWKVCFKHEKIEGAYAIIECSHLDKIVTVRFSSDIPQHGEADYDVRHTARHEALELLLSRMEWLARSRYLFAEDITEERHAVIRRLENLFDDQTA